MKIVLCFPEGQIATSFRTWYRLDEKEKGVLTSFWNLDVQQRRTLKRPLNKFAQGIRVLKHAAICPSGTEYFSVML